jgi:sporulation protein YlmC with PRC-barrel domain
MLRNIKEITGYRLQALDGEIGHCKDFLFDNQHWNVRYMVADTGKWLPGRKVLVSQVSLGEPDWSSRLFSVKLTKEQVEHCPSLHSDAPVSRQYEMKYHKHYGLPHYWSEFGVKGGIAYPDLPYAEKKAAVDTAEPESGDDHLGSAHEMTGYHIHASDGEIGHVEDFIVDDDTWTMHYLVVDTRNWLRGRKVLVAPTWIDSVDWGKNKVIVDLTRKQVKNSPEYDRSAPVNREYETRLYDSYGRSKYLK